MAAGGKKKTKASVTRRLRRSRATALEVARDKGFPYYGYVNVTLSLDDHLVKKVRKIAVDRDTTLTGMVREYLEKVAAEDAVSERRQRQLEALRRSFEKFQINLGNKTGTRAELYERR
jgi:hypothetical protein